MTEDLMIVSVVDLDLTNLTLTFTIMLYTGPYNIQIRGGFKNNKSVTFFTLGGGVKIGLRYTFFSSKTWSKMA